MAEEGAGSGEGGSEPRFKAAALTISTSRAAGEARDDGGPALVEFAESIGIPVAAREMITDDRERIASAMRRLADEEGIDLILTTGGTGFASSDVTPEATRDVIDREAPGFGEAMRLASREHTTKWMLSRSVAGSRGQTLIVNFPGNPNAIAECGAAIAAAVPHALVLLAGGHPH